MYLSFDFRGDRLYLYRKFPLYDKYLYLTKRLVAQAKKAQAYLCLGFFRFINSGTTRWFGIIGVKSTSENLRYLDEPSMTNVTTM